MHRRTDIRAMFAWLPVWLPDGFSGFNDPERLSAHGGK
jgi:hypothetical protein